MGRIKKEPTTKRGQWHKTRCLKVTLIHDPSIKRIDSNLIRKLKVESKLEQARVNFEIRNTSCGELMETVWKSFPSIHGQRFSMWMMRRNNPDLISLPHQITTQQQLCSCDELNRSHLYIKPSGDETNSADSSDEHMISSSSGQVNEAESMNYGLQQADDSSDDDERDDVNIADDSDNDSDDNNGDDEHGNKLLISSDRIQPQESATSPQSPQIFVPLVSYQNPQNDQSILVLLSNDNMESYSQVTDSLNSSAQYYDTADQSESLLAVPVYQINSANNQWSASSDVIDASQRNDDRFMASSDNMASSNNMAFSDNMASSDNMAFSLYPTPSNNRETDDRFVAPSNYVSFPYSMVSSNTMIHPNSMAPSANQTLHASARPSFYSIERHLPDSYRHNSDRRDYDDRKQISEYFRQNTASLQESSAAHFSTAMDYSTVNELNSTKNDYKNCKNQRQENRYADQSSDQHQNNVILYNQRDGGVVNDRAGPSDDAQTISGYLIESNSTTVDNSPQRSFWRCLKCCNILSNAVTLPCLDSFCKECLEVDHDSDNIECPDCQTVYNKSVLDEAGSGVYSLFTRRAVTQYRIENIDEDDKCCEACRSVADRYCMQCNTKFCANCQLSHNLTVKKILRSRPHEIVALGLVSNQNRESVATQGNLGNSSIASAGYQYDKNLSQFSNNVLLSDGFSIEEKFSSFNAKIVNKRNNITNSLNNLYNHENHLSDIQSTIRAAANALKTKIDEWANELMEEAVRRSNIEKVEELKQALKQTSSSHERLAMFTSVVERYGSQQDKIELICKLSDRFDTIQTSDRTVDLSHAVKKMFFRHYEGKDFSKSFTRDKILGRVFPDEGKSFLGSYTTFKIIKQSEPVRGVTVVDDKIFVVHLLKAYVKVINKKRLNKKLQDINIPDMKDPVGMAGCSRNKVLYISDDELKCIHRVNITDNSVKRWSLRENYEPRDLSVTAEHNVLVTVTVWIRDNRGESRVVEYTSEGQLIREIKLDRSIEYAHQTLELSTDRFIICHGVLGSSLRRVCVINSEGEIIKCFGGERGRSEGQLKYPESLTIDKNRQVVFVADWGNDRVVMLDYEMNYLGLVQSRESLVGLSRLYFDFNSDQLIVGEDRWPRGSSRLLIISPDRSVTE